MLSQESREILERDYACLVAGLKDVRDGYKALRISSRSAADRHTDRTILKVAASELRHSLDAIEGVIGGAVSTRFEARDESRLTAAPIVEARILSTPRIEQRAGNLVVTGHAAVFYKANNPGTEFELTDEIIERVSPTTFTRALKQKQLVLCMFDHKEQLGGIFDKTLTLSVDAKGLLYECEMTDDAIGKRIAALLLDGSIKGSSFKFSLAAGGVTWTTEGGKLVRTLTDVDLRDVGPVQNPAYSATTARLDMAKSAQRHSDRLAVLQELKALKALRHKLAAMA